MPSKIQRGPDFFLSGRIFPPDWPESFAESWHTAQGAGLGRDLLLEDQPYRPNLSDSAECVILCTILDREYPSCRTSLRFTWISIMHALPLTLDRKSVLYPSSRTSLHLYMDIQHACYASNRTVRTSNVKTVKDKRSTSVPQTFIPESAPSKEIMFIWSRRTDSGPNRNNLFQCC